jgi:hypothetical protein
MILRIPVERLQGIAKVLQLELVIRRYHLVQLAE